MNTQEKSELEKNMKQKCDTVSQVLKACDASQSAVSQYINRMRLEGLVSSEKRGSFVYCKIADPKVNQLIQCLYKIYCN